MYVCVCIYIYIYNTHTHTNHETCSKIWKVSFIKLEIELFVSDQYRIMTKFCLLMLRFDLFHCRNFRKEINYVFENLPEKSFLLY